MRRNEIRAICVEKYSMVADQQGRDGSNGITNVIPSKSNFGGSVEAYSGFIPCPLGVLMKRKNSSHSCHSC